VFIQHFLDAERRDPVVSERRDHATSSPEKDQ